MRKNNTISVIDMEGAVVYLGYFDTVTLADIDKVAEVILSHHHAGEKFNGGSSKLLALLTNSKTGETVKAFQTFNTHELLEQLYEQGYTCGLTQTVGSQEATFEIYKEDGTKKVTCSVIAPVDSDEFEKNLFDPESTEVDFLHKIDEQAYDMANFEHVNGWEIDHTKQWVYKPSGNVPGSSRDHIEVFLQMVQGFFTESS